MMQCSRRATLVAIIAISLLQLATIRYCMGQESPEGTPSRVTKPASLDELLLFFPAKYPRGDWDPKGLRFQDVFFESQDGTKLHGWYCPVEKPRAMVLIAHGNAGHVASRAAWLRYLQTQLNVSTLMFDYRGYGRSEGRPTVEGVIQDATAARKKLCELAGVQQAEILLMGESLGGAVMVQLAVRTPPRGLILQSTFSSLREVADIHFPKLSWLVPKSKLASVAEIGEYRGPLLQSHGNADRTIPIASGKRLFEAANEPKEFVVIDQADHNDWLTAAYVSKLDRFIGRLATTSERRDD